MATGSKQFAAGGPAVELREEGGDPAAGGFLR